MREYRLPPEKRLQFVDYIPYIFPHFEFNWHNDVIIKHLQDFADGKVKRLMIFMPPRHGKSLLCSILLPSYIFYLYSKQKVMLLTYGHDLSKDLGQELRDVLRSPEWQGIANNNIRGDTRGKNLFMLKDGSRFYGVGRDGSITGKGADFLLCDDMVKNQQEADSKTIREHILHAYRTVANTRLESKESGIIHLITRWRVNDLPGTLLEEDLKNPDESKRENWKVVRIAALAEEDEEWEGTAGRTYTRRKGSALWTNKFDRESLEKIRDTMGPEFTGLYQQRPAALKGEIFERRDWRFYKPENLPKGEDVKVILLSLDTAFKTTERADFSVILAGLIGMDGNLYLLDCAREKLEFNDLKDFTKQMVKLYRPDWTLIEDRASGTSLYQEMIDDDESSLISGFEPISKKYNKEENAQAIKALVQRHKVYLPETVLERDVEWFDPDWVQSFIDELSEFPKGTHDDRVDAFTQMMMYARVHHYFDVDDDDLSAPIIAVA